jgi:hypothetical protein|tara:strand:+ start:115 stop:966 length:852 start_codon:yes stop_codon:yes gene_type:complete
MRSLSFRKINNKKVKPIVIKGGEEEEDNRPVKGCKLFSELYANIFMCARKKSGKTVCAGKIIKECATKDTNVIVFCPTLHKDKNHLLIKKYCKKKGIPYMGYSSTEENGVNILKELTTMLEEEAKKREEEKEEEERNGKKKEKDILMMLFNDDEDEEGERKRKSKYQSPEYIIFFDDISDELRKPMLRNFLKKNRHYRSKVIVSSQYVHDLLPEQLKQIDYSLVFKKMSDDKLLKMKRDFDLLEEDEDLLNIYKQATEDDFSFLYIDCADGGSFRKNFNTAII